MDELVRWLNTCLDEDERIARAAAGLQADPENGWGISDRAITPHIGVVHEDEARAHIVEHNPARVLREIDAKRQLLAIHRPYVPEPDQACLGCAGGIMFTSCPVVRLLALPYADREGYQEAWRP